ncbi:MAG: sugar phosphate isomerase/epimerase [Clostridia bacterium]|nr:sugar phosphate isomerase/epimerase [Clostridia bacterium]
MQIIWGINHMFLYPEAMVNRKVHTDTLKKLAESPGFDALDMWVWRGDASKEEIRILRDSGKIINYNIGDRFGEEIAFPSSADKAQRERAYSLMMREIGYALELGSKKIIFGSGPDVPEDRNSAKERYFELISRVMNQLPDDVELSFEPTDRDTDKYFLFGPLDETVEFIRQMQKSVNPNIGLLLDMCHIPLIHETIDSAVSKGIDVLNHIHLGNCVIKNKQNPFYGDKHPPFGYADSEYTEDDCLNFIGTLRKAGYFDKQNTTVSFEMRPYENMSSADTVSRLIALRDKAMSILGY